MLSKQPRIVGVSTVVATAGPHAAGGLLVAAVLILATGGCTQATNYYPADVDDIRPGDRVRVHTDGGDREIGSITRRDSSSLMIRLDDAETVPIELSSIRSMDRFAGTSGHGGVGLAIGATAGATIGLVVSLVKGIDEGLDSARHPTLRSASDPPPPRNEADLTPILVGGLIGGLVGYMVGEGATTEHWQPVRSERFGFDIEPAPNRARAGVLWNF